MPTTLPTRFIAWGLSVSRKLIFDSLSFQVDAIVDRNATYKRDPWTGIRVIKPDELLNFNPDNTTIIVTADIGTNFSAIKDQALEFGHHNVVPFTKYFPTSLEIGYNDYFEDIRRFKETETRGLKNRVAILIWELVVGGAEKQALLLKSGLESIGVEVTLICCIASSNQRICGEKTRSLLYRDTENSPQLTSKAERHIYEATCQTTYPLIAFLSAKLYTELVNTEPTAIVAYLEAPMLCAAMADRYYGIENLLFRGWLAPTDQLPPTFLNCDYGVAKDIIYTSVKTRRATFVTDSEMGVQSYKRWLNIKVTHVPNAIEQISHKHRVDETLRIQCSNKQRKFIITAIRLVPQKNPHYFVNLIKRINDKGIPVQASILGDGPMREEIQEYIRALNLTEIVSIEGFRDDVGEYMATADLFILTSLFEGMSNALMEACAAKLPFIASRTVGALNAIPSYLNEWLVDLTDEEAFLKKSLDALAGKFVYDDDLQKGWLLNHSKEKLAKDLLRLLPKPI